MYLFFDTETTSVLQTNQKRVNRLVQLGWVLVDEAGNEKEKNCYIVKPDGYRVSLNEERIHGISHERACYEGVPAQQVLEEFANTVNYNKPILVGHAVKYDIGVVNYAYKVAGLPNPIENLPSVCTVELAKHFKKKLGLEKINLTMLHRQLIGVDFAGAHDALNDSLATKACFFAIKNKTNFETKDFLKTKSKSKKKSIATMPNPDALTDTDKNLIALAENALEDGNFDFAQRLGQKIEINTNHQGVKALAQALTKRQFVSFGQQAEELKKLPDAGSKVTFTDDLPPGFELSTEMKQVFEAVESFNQNVFLTGKAGTGKSTFLKYLRAQSAKKIVLLAPTGVAAIQVGGGTLHSFFRLPFRPIQPNDKGLPKLGPKIRKIISELDLLVIDEISMVRADVLQAIDYQLRHNGGKASLPFGGKQLLIVGDLFQLKPVVTRNDTSVISFYDHPYQTPFFFGAPVFFQADFKTYGLSYIYRQSEDPDFKNMLNRIRNADWSTQDQLMLNNRVLPNGVQPHPGTIMLVATNKQADAINNQRLAQINAEAFSFEAEFWGEVGGKPADQTLTLKVGAQVMMIKNDVDKKWVNGNLGEVVELNKDCIKVKLQHDGNTYKIEPAVWQSLQYNWNAEEKTIDTEVVGEFEQFPLRLAWAITIHKSQGLTFDKVHIDMGRGAFAHGQTYVALSRCRSLNGISLASKINTKDLMTDADVMSFCAINKIN